jgi:AcrR family transcriptional regulator
MPRDAQATRQRLLDAAYVEFAQYGIAGARVDRIAAEAGANKALLYHHFESKDGLFDAVFNAMCERTVDESPIDADDLPGYAGRLFDRFEADPAAARLATWYRLERADTQEPLAIVLASMRDKVAAVAKAQKAGTLTRRFSAVDLLGLVLQVAMTWSAMTPEYVAMVKTHSRAHRRKVVVDAVAALLGD